jgi:nitrate reductase / nitrite oxidoreductase, alpha subunit
VLREGAGGSAKGYEGVRPGKYLRANRLEPYNDQENGDLEAAGLGCKASGRARMPKGTIGFRWQSEQGKWNLEMKDGVDG